MQIRWTEEAIQDIQSLRAYIGEDKPTAARKVVSKIFASVKALTLHPHIGRPGRLPNTRQLLVTGTPYIVPYRVTGGVLEILRVLHGSMEWPEEL